MISKNLFRIALISTALIGGAVASANAKDAASAAGTGGTHQNHHCKQSDGSMDMGKTKKACMAAKGTWVKDGQAPAAVAPAAAGSAAAKK